MENMNLRRNIGILTENIMVVGKECKIVNIECDVCEHYDGNCSGLNKGRCMINPCSYDRISHYLNVMLEEIKFNNYMLFRILGGSKKELEMLLNDIKEEGMLENILAAINISDEELAKYQSKYKMNLSKDELMSHINKIVELDFIKESSEDDLLDDEEDKPF